jgi:hypothetical protein
MKNFLLYIILLWSLSLSAQRLTNVSFPSQTLKDSTYQLNNIGNDASALFDGVTTVNFTPSSSTMLASPHTIVIMLPDAWHANVKKIRIYDGSGQNIDHGSDTTKFYLKRKSDSALIYVGYYLGTNFNQWDSITIPQAGVTTGAVSVSALTNFECSRIYITGGNLDQYGSEVDVQGDYTPATLTHTYPPRQQFPFRNMMGANGYWYYYSDAAQKAMMLQDYWPRFFFAWDDSMEVKKDSFWFNHRQWDTVFANASILGAQHVTVAVDRIPDYIYNGYPGGSQDRDNNASDTVGLDRKNPRSYTRKGKIGFQLAARYAFNSSISSAYFRAYQPPGLGVKDVQKWGQATVHQFSSNNESDKTWKGRLGYQLPAEAGAEQSAFYDGYKGLLGADVGVKTASPTARVSMSALAFPWFLDYMYGYWDYIQDTLKGQFPLDVLEVHYYSNDAFGSQTGGTSGACPEQGGLITLLDKYNYLRYFYFGGRPMQLTEYGYDRNQSSPQHAPPIAPKDSADVQADWTLRTQLICWKQGCETANVYQGFDDAPGSATRHMTDGIYDNAGQGGPRRRKAADFMYQASALIGNYVSDTGWIATSPYVLHSTDFTHQKGDVYVLWSGTQNGTSTTYNLTLPTGTVVNVWKPVAGASVMTELITGAVVSGGAYTVTVDETPRFVEVVNPTPYLIKTLKKSLIPQ